MRKHLLQNFSESIYITSLVGFCTVYDLFRCGIAVASRWLFENSVCIGVGNAKVYDDAIIFSDAKIHNSAYVGDDMLVDYEVVSPLVKQNADKQ